MLKRLFTFVFAVLLTAVLTYGHGGAKHVMGTITAVDGDHLTIKTKGGKATTVMLTSATKFHSDSGNVVRSDLKPGVRVVVDGVNDKTMKMLSATEIHLGASKPSAKSTKKPATHKHD